MTRIKSTSPSGAPQIPSQNSAPQEISKPQSQKTQQEPNAAEQQQGKQAAQGRKSDIDLHGNLKQSELAQYHGPGGGPGGVQATHGKEQTVPDAISSAGERVKGKLITREELDTQLSDIVKPSRKSEEELQNELNRLTKGLNERLDQDYEIKRHAEEKAAQVILDKYFPKKESNSSKKVE
jgi:hypothetical protein